MKLQYLPGYAIALAIAFVGALWLGAPVQTLLLFGLVLVCPLMMLFMMRGMNSRADHSGRPSDEPHDSVRRRTPGRS